MSMLRFTLGEMILCLESLLQQKEARTIIDSNPLLALLVPRLEAALNNLIDSREKPKITALSPTEESQLKKDLTVADQEHDQANRFLHALLDLTAKHASDGLLRLQAQEILASLFPYGLQVVRMKYADEAGEAKRLGKQLESSGLQDLLRSFRVSFGQEQTHALQQAEKIVASGRSLQTILLQLSGLSTEPPAVGEARRSFFKEFGLFLHNAEAALESQPEVLNLLLKKYNELHKDAGQRSEDVEPPQPPPPPA